MVSVMGNNVGVFGTRPSGRPSRLLPSTSLGATSGSYPRSQTAQVNTYVPRRDDDTSESTRQSLGNIEASAAPTESAAPRRINWRDAAYNEQMASIQKALEEFETGAQNRGERYGQDYMTGLTRMGYRPAQGFQAMPNILEQLNQPQAISAASTMEGVEGGGAPSVVVPPVAGAFDIEGQFDPYSSAAQGTRGLRDEFAGRGTLRSSDFAKTFGEFQNRLNQQLEAMETSRGRFGQDLATEVAQQRTQAEERRQAAQRDAMMRAAISAAQSGGF